MSSLSKELVFLMLQFLDEEKYKETVHKLEKESGFYFNMRYFEETVTNGEWDEVESYLFGFTKVDDNRYSMKIFFEIRKQKYLEALDKHDNDKAVDILRKDLKVFSTFNEDLFKEITLLLSLENFRENAQLSKYGNTTTARAIMLGELKKLIEANPLFRDKLQFPSLKNSRLRTLINQSLNWQHQLCKNPKNNPDIKTLFVDHNCAQINGVLAPSPVTNPMMGGIPKVGGYPPLGAHGPFQPTPASLTASLAGWISNPSSVPHQTISLGPMSLAAPTVSASMLKHPRTPATNNPAIDYMADSEHVLKRARPLGIPEEVNNMPVAYPGQIPVHTSFSSVDLPKTVIVNLSLGSAVSSMDFNPAQQTLLLVGTHKGDTTLWEVGCRERLAIRNFKTWNPGSLSLPLQASLANECSVGVTRVIWSPDGALFGVAYAKNIVHVYSYRGGDDIRNHLEIDAHVGTVNDLAFAYPNKQLCIITCGDDKTIKVWDIENGSKRYTFEGHEAPVYSVCPHHKENIQFIFSTSLDGKIKAWLYDTAGSRVDYDAPGHFCTTMAYSADGTRLFSCGTSKDGESHIVEWNESEGAVKRAYHGLGKCSEAVVQFDTLKNRFLAAGDEFQVKIWDMDNINLLTATDAEGGLMSTPKIRFNKEGMLLAVSTKDNGIKILANTDGCRLLRSIENRALDASRVAAGSLVKGPGIGTFAASTSTPVTSVGIPDRTAPLMAMVALNGDNQSLPDVKPRITEESEKCKIWKPTEISEPSQLRSLRLADKVLVARGTCCANKSPGCCTIHSHPDRVHLHFKNMQVGPIMLCLSQQIVRLKYTNSGSAILALTYNAVHQLWKWPKGNQNPTGKATTGLSPELWQPASGMLMTNEINATNTEDPVSCFALSKNDSYVMSASGGKISLFNMMTFKTMAKFMPPPPAATYLAFHPQDNNIVAIGMDDSSIQIYNVRVDEVKSKLKGHQKKVTGLAFSNALNVLVSSGADAQLCVWSTDAWEKQASKFLQLPAGRVPAAVAHTHVQFHQDQIHLLAVHETQLGIYEARKLECVNQWSPPQDSSGAITDATYSCDSQTIFASFEDGSVGVFAAASLRMRCLINAKAYLTSNPSQRLYPVVITTHPIEPSQFALGLSDGGVHVIEPLENEAGWGHCGPT